MWDTRYVRIDLHRRRSVVVHLDLGGESSMVRLHNDAASLAEEITRAGSALEVVMEAAYDPTIALQGSR